MFSIRYLSNIYYLIQFCWSFPQTILKYECISASISCRFASVLNFWGSWATQSNLMLNYLGINENRESLLQVINHFSVFWCAFISFLGWPDLTPDGTKFVSNFLWTLPIRLIHSICWSRMPPISFSWDWCSFGQSSEGTKRYQFVFAFPWAL